MAVVATGCGAGRAAGHLTAQPTSAPQEPLAAFIEKTKEVQTRASTQPVNVLGTTVETFDTELGAALFQAKLHPTSAAARRVAAAYARLGIFDKAHEYLQRAVKSDPGNAANYEALARLWRDVRMPYLGLSDAHRAVYYAPDWPVAHNTLATLLQAMGQRANARVEYERALVLEPSAAYALNNLCYSDILDGRIERALQRCHEALKADPQLRAAQNNLGLAYAASGRMDAAFDAFNLAVDPAGALYNMGVARMARGEYRSAVEAFQAAQAEKPTLALAAARAEQARARIGAGE
jgi:tetratricopeptide (TPR) repeat protein